VVQKWCTVFQRDWRFEVAPAVTKIRAEVYFIDVGCVVMLNERPGHGYLGIWRLGDPSSAYPWSLSLNSGTSGPYNLMVPSPHLAVVAHREQLK
jgi:hypothetical protein